MSQDYQDILPGDSLSSSLAKIEGRDAAVATQFQGTTAPSSPFAYQFWLDTTTGILKIRNAANNAWISLGLFATDFGMIRKDGTNSPSANIDWGGFKITNLADPTSAQHAATQAWTQANMGYAGKRTAKLTWDTSAGGGLINNGGGVTLRWTEAIDQGSFVTVENNSEVKLTVAGTYLIICRILAAGTGSGAEWEIRKAARTGTTQKIAKTNVTGNTIPLVITDIITFAANDNFDIHDIPGSSPVDTGSATSYSLEIILLYQ